MAAAAAFCTYFCMYAFRKPFTAATFEGQEAFGLSLKAVLVISQLTGYLLSKVIGVKVISEMRSQSRALAIVGLIGLAEAALVGFAVLPLPLKVAMMFLNGIPLGMVFGLVMSYLEGRQHTEALAAVLCASFIASSGVVKSVGQWLMQTAGLSEFSMPMVAGLLFFPPLLLSVWMLQRTPPPDEADRRLRSERPVMNGQARWEFLSAYGPGLALLVLVYVALTVCRTVRDDFGVEIWRDLGVQQPSIFAGTETVVTIFVTALNAMAILIRGNLTAIRATVGLMCGAFGLTGASVLFQWMGGESPFAFMVACGVGLYVPYVAFHTTIFERLIAASKRHCNIGFLMYLADSVGYLGYAVVIVLKTSVGARHGILPFFTTSLLIVSGLSIACLLTAILFFKKVLSGASEQEAEIVPAGIPAGDPQDSAPAPLSQNPYLAPVPVDET
jgi:hypothetical protein